MSKTIVLASGNRYKIKEIAEIMPDYNIIAMKELGFEDDIIEDGNTLLDNSLIKAKAVRKFLDSNGYDYLVMADDSGLFCDGLNGEPGIYSARYAGEHASYEANRQKLLSELQNVSDRRASFRCCIVLLDNNGNCEIGNGETKGEILKKYAGNTDFCYDCVFYSYELNKSFGEATEEEKNSVSHRAKAVHDLVNKMKHNNWGK